MKAAVFLLGMLVSSAALSSEVRVVSIQPKYVTVYQQQCQQVQVREDNSGLGTVIGAVAGGIIGNQVGRGSGNVAATVAGTVVGGAVGNRIGSDQANMVTRQECRQTPVTVQQGEVVTFQYRGRTFTQTFD
jgi:uncharacterized protein YcfJ